MMCPIFLFVRRIFAIKRSRNGWSTVYLKGGLEQNFVCSVFYLVKIKR